MGYHPFDKIDFETFMEVNGLADIIMHNAVHGEYVGMGAGSTFTDSL